MEHEHAGRLRDQVTMARHEERDGESVSKGMLRLDPAGGLEDEQKVKDDMKLGKKEDRSWRQSMG